MEQQKLSCSYGTISRGRPFSKGQNKSSIYQSLYFVPSEAVSCDFVYTSNTFCSPRESNSGSSCSECSPHSAFPVIGSMGIRRRNFSFLPLTSTPFTNVPRSGGYPRQLGQKLFGPIDWLHREKFIRRARQRRVDEALFSLLKKALRNLGSPPLFRP